MDIFQAISTGIIQGATEFLPVSSSGHLFLVRNLFELNYGTEYVVLLHAGTLIAVFAFLWKEILNILQGIFKGKLASWKLVFALIAGTVPAAVLGITIEDFLEKSLTGNITIGISLLLTGALLFLSDSFKRERYTIKDIGVKLAIIIGLFQAAAIVPGISRSGMTLFGALLVGVKRDDAFRFSFLLSIPVILGGTLLDIKNITAVDNGLWGFVFAIAVGFVSLWILRILTRAKKLKYFAFYCWLAGVLSIFVL